MAFLCVKRFSWLDPMLFHLLQTILSAMPHQSGTHHLRNIWWIRPLPNDWEFVRLGTLGPETGVIVQSTLFCKCYRRVLRTMNWYVNGRAHLAWLAHRPNW